MKTRIETYQESSGEFSGWIARIESPDIVAQGETEQKAIESLNRLVKMHEALRLRRGLGV
jgi:predicted RNase H-like HicB family nuclease